MFGLGLKERSAEALRRGTKAIVLGGFTDQSEMEKFHLNEAASAFLYSEALAHKVFALNLVYKASLVGKHSWATPEFFLQNIVKVLVEEENRQGLPPGTFSRVLINRLTSFEALSTQNMFKVSAQTMSVFDPDADIEKISKALQKMSYEFAEQTRKVFGV